MQTKLPEAGESAIMRKQIGIALMASVLAAAIFAGAKASPDKYSLLKWGQPPGEWGHTSSVVSDHKDLMLVLRRADPPILVFNSEGKVVNSFGTGMFER